MMVSGILWYDDDAQRTLDEKIAEAAQRYRERIGFEPTACELNAAQAAAPRLAKAGARHSTKRVEPAVPAHNLSLIPTEHLRPNYFLVGLAEGEQPRRVQGWHDPADDQDALPTRRAGRGNAAAPQAVPPRSRAKTPAPPTGAAEGAPPAAAHAPSPAGVRPAARAKNLRTATRTATAKQPAAMARLRADRPPSSTAARSAVPVTSAAPAQIPSRTARSTSRSMAGAADLARTAGATATPVVGVAEPSQTTKRVLPASAARVRPAAEPVALPTRAAQGTSTKSARTAKAVAPAASKKSTSAKTDAAQVIPPLRTRATARVATETPKPAQKLAPTAPATRAKTATRRPSAVVI